MPDHANPSHSFASALTLDIPYARKVLEHLIAHPEEHNQNHYGVRSVCGTTACIAGTTVLLDSDTSIYWNSDSSLASQVLTSTDIIDIDMRAAELLGLEDSDVRYLFYLWDNADALCELASFIDQAEAAQSV